MTRCTPPQNSAFPAPEAQVACASGGGPKSTRCACVGGSVHLAEKEIINLSFSRTYTRCTPHAPTCASGGNLGSFSADRVTRCTLSHTRTSGASEHGPETNTPPTLDADVDQLVARATTDAESLLSAVAAPDEPDGIRIVRLTAPAVWGLCRGSGHAVARAYGFDAGIAVMVAGYRIAEGPFIAAAQTVEDLLDELRVRGAQLERLRASARAVAGNLARLSIEATATHELGHALAADVDKPPTDVEVAEIIALPTTFVREDTPEVRARGHGPAWAAATAILYQRCQAIRPAVAGKWRKMAETEFHGYGMTLAAVADAVRYVPADAAIRPLVRNREFMARIEAVVPSLEERIALIVKQRAATAQPQQGVPAADKCPLVL